MIWLNYLKAALWADAPEAENNNGNGVQRSYEIKDLSMTARKTAKKDIAVFLKNAQKMLDVALTDTDLGTQNFWARVGNDLWLTRNGHGAGFWDHPHSWAGQKNADKLTAVAEKLGSRYLYVGDSGKVEFG